MPHVEETRAEGNRAAAAHGFTMTELLVAAGLTLLLLAEVTRLVVASQAAILAEPQRLDLRMRARAAAQTVGAEVWAAGAGAVGGIDGAALGAWMPVVLPFRLGTRGADPPGTARDDVITLLASDEAAVAPALRQPASPPAEWVVIAPLPPCPAADPSCDLRVGATVLLVDGRGQWDLFGVAETAGDRLRLVARGAVSGRPYPTGSRVIPVAVSTFYLRNATDIDGRQLSRYDGHQSDLPVLDHVVHLRIEYFGEAAPPRKRADPAAGEPPMTYGPAPPAIGEDDARDAWPPGENCVIAVVDGNQVPRLPVLGPGSQTLQPLPGSLLSDGPWCPDASARNRYDADLLRVRQLRISLRLEAGKASNRGSSALLFQRPGQAGALVMVPDESFTFTITSRNSGG
jgi:hypothetical protein